jgi:hypothetical protein
LSDKKVVALFKGKVVCLKGKVIKKPSKCAFLLRLPIFSEGLFLAVCYENIGGGLKKV